MPGKGWGLKRAAWWMEGKTIAARCQHLKLKAIGKSSNSWNGRRWIIASKPVETQEQDQVHLFQSCSSGAKPKPQLSELIYSFRVSCCDCLWKIIPDQISFRNHIHSHLHSISWQGLHTTAFASQDQWAINLQTFPPLLLYQCTLRHALRGKFLRPNGSKPKSAFWWSLIRRLWFSYSLGQSVWCLYYLVLHRYFSAANLCKRSPEGFSMSRPQFSSPEYIYLSGVIEVDGCVCHFDNIAPKGMKCWVNEVLMVFVLPSTSSTNINVQHPVGVWCDRCPSWGQYYLPPSPMHSCAVVKV